MPTITNPTVVQLLAEHFTSNGLNKAEALIDTGYSQSYARGSKGMRLFERPAVINAIARIQSDLKQIMGGSREKSARDYEQARLAALRLNQPAAAVSAIRWRDGLYGLQSLDNNQSEKVIIVINPPALPLGDNATKQIESNVIDSDVALLADASVTSNAEQCNNELPDDVTSQQNSEDTTQHSDIVTE